MKKGTCWTKMLSSINFLHKRNSKSKTPKQASKFESRSNTESIKQSNTVAGKQNQSTNQKPQNQNQASKDLRVKSALNETPYFKEVPKTGQNQCREVEQEPRQTERNFIESDGQSQNPGQSDQNSLPTEKSQIIMNDIGKDIDQNENNFLYDQNYEQVGNFSQVYEKFKLIQSSVIYEEYLAKKKTTGEIRKAYLMRSYESFAQQWNLAEEEAIEKYSDLYEREKHHIKNLITLAKKNCRHLTKLLDYELKPPTINTNESNKFIPGSIVVVFETVDSTLTEQLKQNKNISRTDKKKFIFQISTCLSDIHQQNLSVKDLSIQSFGLDKFGNIKMMSLEIEDFDAKFYQSQDVRDKVNLIYLTPQELDAEVKSDRMAENKTFFCSGFSQISDFDKVETTPEKQNLWKLGIICVKILSGKFIFNEPTANQQKDKIKEMLEIKSNSTQAKPTFHEILSNLSFKEMKTVQSLLQINPDERSTCKQLLTTEYLTNILDESFQQNQRTYF